MKRTMVGLTLFLLVTSAWAGTLVDNFDADGNVDDETLSNWRRNRFGDQTAQWFVKDGVLVAVSENVCTLGSGIVLDNDTSLTWRNYECQIDFKIERTLLAGCGSSIVGIAGRVDDSTSNNLVEFYPHTQNANWNDFFCDFLVAGNFTVGSRGNFPIEEKTWYTARFVVNENQFTAFINDEQICDFQGNIPETGSVLPFVRNAEVHFDNLRITGDTIPDLVAVELQGKLATKWAAIKQGR